MIKKLSKIKIFVVFRLLFTFFFFTSFSSIYCSEVYKNDNDQNRDENVQDSVSFEYYSEDFLRYGDFIYTENIKTVLFYKSGFELSPPLIKHNSNEKLTLKFDDLDADHKSYAYTIIHCNADWQPSGLSNYDYIDGFYDDEITNYEFSLNTIIPYTHYTLQFPNENIKPRLSGNYILKVYIQGYPEEVVLTRKFKIYEQLVSLEGNVTKATLVSKRDEMQEVNFTINSSTYRISNPYQDIKVSIKQNGRTDNIIWDLKPKMVLGDKLVYEYEEKNLFEGGNEFRQFDIRSLRFATESVSDIVATHSHYEVYLLNDPRRSSMRYTFNEDINGQYNIKNNDGYESHIDSDYAWVYFSLNYPIPEENGNFYVTGALTDWNYTSENRMNYSFRDKKYHTSLLLKQGYYNYQYIFLQDGSRRGSTFRAEGSHSDTENEYSIFVYHRKPGDMHDSLIGLLHLNSGVN